MFQKRFGMVPGMDCPVNNAQEWFWIMLVGMGQNYPRSSGNTQQLSEWSGFLPSPA